MNITVNNRMRKWILVMSMIFTMLIPTTVSAARSDVDSITYIGTGQTVLVRICAQANDVVDEEILVYTGNDGMLSFSNKKYTALALDDRKKFMETALLGIKESGMNAQVKNRSYNFVADQDSSVSGAVKFLQSDTSADFASASAWFKPFGSVAGTLLGLLSLFIFMFLGLSIVIDIAYMVIPMFRVFVDGRVQERPKFISREAWSAVKESEQSIGSNSTYKGYMGLYLQHRSKTIIGMSIALSYLISGQIYDVIAFFIDSFGKIFG